MHLDYPVCSSVTHYLLLSTICHAWVPPSLGLGRRGGGGGWVIGGGESGTAEGSRAGSE